MSATSHSAIVRQYLVDKKVAPLMEQFMADIIEARPDDVLGFLKTWAIEKHAMQVGLADASREAEAEAAAATTPAAATQEEDQTEETQEVIDTRDPLQVVSEAWAAHVQAPGLLQAVVAKFFEILFLQKPILKQSLFDGVDIDAASERLGPIVDAAFTGALRDDVLVEFCRDVAVGTGVEERHLSSFLTAMHAAITSTWTLQTSDDINDPLNKYLRELAARVRTSIEEAEQIAALENGETPRGNEAEGGSDDESPENAVPDSRPPLEIVQESWNKLPDAAQSATLNDAWSSLLQQHVVLTKGPLADLSVEDLVTLLRPVVNSIASGSAMTVDQAKDTAFTKEAATRGLQQRHLDYLVTALLGALSRQFGTQWSTISDAWSAILTSTAATFKEAAFPSTQQA